MRCFTCNTYVADTWEHFLREEKKKNCRVFFKRHDVKLMCCRRMFLTHAPVVEDIKTYSNVDETVDESNTRFMCRVAVARTASCD